VRLFNLVENMKISPIMFFFIRTSRKKLKAESGEVLDEKEHDSAELGFMFEAGDEDDDDEDEVSRADFLKI
jgi:hypothetical protein